MRPRARDNHRELPAMRAVPAPRPTTARIRRWTGASSNKWRHPLAFPLSYRPAGRSPQPASACSDRQSRLH